MSHQHLWTSPPLLPSGPGTFSGPKLTTPYLRGQRFLAPPFRFPVSANHTTGRTCARPRTTTDVLLIITLYSFMVSELVWLTLNYLLQVFLEWKSLPHWFFFFNYFLFQSKYARQLLTVVNNFILYRFFIYLFIYLEILKFLLILSSLQCLWSWAALALGNRPIKSWSLSLSFSFICFPDSVHSRKPQLKLLSDSTGILIPQEDVGYRVQILVTSIIIQAVSCKEPIYHVPCDPRLSSRNWEQLTSSSAINKDLICWDDKMNFSMWAGM